VGLAAGATIYALAHRPVRRVQEALLRSNRELLALHGAGLLVAADLSLDSVLQTVADSARSLIGTRFGALSVVDEGGRVEAFRFSGLDEEVAARIGQPPRGRGLLGVVLREGQRLRLQDLQRDSRSAGFPPDHPPMRTLLAVPVLCRTPHRGNLYLSEKVDGSHFTAEDEETLVRFAHQAAVAIDNAFLHRQVQELAAARERIRIAHEMHDGLAQVLAYVNTKAQVVREYLRQGRLGDAEGHLEQLSEAAREVYGDVREQILELRTTTPGEAGLARSLTEYVEKWERQSGIQVDVALPETLQLSPEPELQLLRILQEALTNVRKHAHAERVRVALEQRTGEVRLLIADDGTGFDLYADSPRQGPRFGLKTMQERAESIGGKLTLQSTPGAGTRVELRVPITPMGTAKEDRNAPSHR
jgi:signal transduction histidine kinase